MASFYGVLFCACVVYSMPAEVNDRGPIVLIISFDAFRYDYTEVIDLPKIKSLKMDGSSAEYMMNVFETKTFPNHQSIATGLYSESHGVIANSLFDPKYGRKLDYGAELYEYEGVIPIWTLNEMAGNGRHSGVMMWPGGEFPYGNANDGSNCPESNGILPTFNQKWEASVPWNYRVDTVMEWMTHNETPTNLVMLYFEEPDSTSHMHGPDSNEAKEQVRKVDATLAYICEKITAKNLTDVINMIVLSDHGMQTVTPSRLIDLTLSVNTSLYRVPNSSPAMHIYPLPGLEEEVFQQLNATAAKEAFSVYRKADMPERWHVRQSRRTPPIIIVADDGYVFQDFYSTMDYYRKKFNITPSQNQTYGVHGYDNSLKSMHPFFFAWGPLFKKGYVIPPFESIDLFPLVSKILSLPPHAVNGSLENVESILVSANSEPFLMQNVSPWVLIVGIAVLVIIIIGGATVVSVMLLSKRKHMSGYERQMEQNLSQSNLKEMGIEEQRLLSESDED